MDTGIATALIASLGGVLITLLGLYGANKAGIGKTQEKLVSSLKDLVDVQQRQITELEGRATTNEKRIKDLENEISRLKDITISQAETISTLRRRRPVNFTGGTGNG